MLDTVEATAAVVPQPVKAWLLARKPELGDIDADLDLIENRVIDSLQFVEFLLLLEEVSGREISVSEITVDAFRTLRSIRANFFNGDPRSG